ncbi:plexin-B3-like isoform X3 [Petromyzon marinus]|uniref:plexin-B3-like isoform X3 n=1 Tax=Petromyzon marinus TaxID=7757 RepID=UPI003F71AC9C
MSSSPSLSLLPLCPPPPHLSHSSLYVLLPLSLLPLRPPPPLSHSSLYVLLLPISLTPPSTSSSPSLSLLPLCPPLSHSSLYVLRLLHHHHSLRHALRSALRSHDAAAACDRKSLGSCCCFVVVLLLLVFKPRTEGDSREPLVPSDRGEEQQGRGPPPRRSNHRADPRVLVASARPGTPKPPLDTTPLHSPTPTRRVPLRSPWAKGGRERYRRRRRRTAPAPTSPPPPRGLRRLRSGEGPRAGAVCPSRAAGMRTPRCLLTPASALLALLCYCVPVCWGADAATTAITVSTPTALNHLLVDNETGRVYVGAVNFVYQFDAFLTRQSELGTGPVNDSKECLPPLEHCKDTQLANNSNMLLVLDRSGGSLVVCGSVHHGTCAKLAPDDVSQKTFWVESPTYSQTVVSSNASVRVVGFVAPGVGGEDMLFVGSGMAPYKLWPMCTRHLHQLPAGDAFTVADRAHIVGEHSTYHFAFAAAFAHAGHAYFVFARHESTLSTSPFTSYVARVCLGDDTYQSYVEAPLSCRDGASAYPLAQDAYLAEGVGSELARSLAGGGGDGDGTGPVLFVAFAATQGHGGLPLNESALCLFPLGRIAAVMKRARVSCYQGSDKDSHVQYISLPCRKEGEDSEARYPCGSEHLATPITSKVPTDGTFLGRNNDACITAVAVTTEEERTYAFLGTNKGQLSRAFIADKDGFKDSITLLSVPGAIKQDMELSNDSKYIYVMAENNVSRVPVSSCRQHADCVSCVAARDPYCGWCVLEGRCSRRSECRSSDEPNRWRWSYDKECLRVEEVAPANISWVVQQEITLQVDGLPALGDGETYTCSFLHHNVPATLSGSSLACHTPEIGALTWNGTDHMVVPLVLRFEGVEVAASSFTYFNCNAVAQTRRNAPCAACVGSPWSCHWCVHSHECTHEPSCEEGPIIHNAQHELAVPMKGPDSCPCLESFSSASLVPARFSTALAFVARNLNLLETQMPAFECLVTVDGKSHAVGAQASDVASSETVITCDVAQYDYDEAAMEVPADVTVRWTSQFNIDNHNDLQVTLYKCGEGRRDCSQCLAANASYGCQWCGAEPTCVYNKTCAAPLSACPAPNIVRVEPTTGALQGGTRLTVWGHDMGQRVDDVEAVTVAGAPCPLVVELYEISIRVVCLLSSVSAVTQGPVELKLRGFDSAAVAPRLFSYQDPRPREFLPVKGPRAGGTMLRVLGDDLLSGSAADVSVTVGNAICRNVEVTESEVKCRTSSYPEPGEAEVVLNYGPLAQRRLSGLYTYTLDPEVHNVEPKESFISGGRTILVTGTNLDSVEQPLVRVEVVAAASSWSTPVSSDPSNDAARRRRSRRWARRSRAVAASSTLCRPGTAQRHRKPQGTAVLAEDCCEVLNETSMSCYSPSVSAVVPPGASTRLLFIMDDLQLDYGQFRYVSDPKMLPLNHEDPSKPYKFKPGSLIVAKGENLKQAISQVEVRATLGDQECEIRTLTDNDLYCNPSASAPTPKRTVNFTVNMGYLEYNLGPVEYDMEVTNNFPFEAQVGVGVAATVLILLVIAVILIYRRKSKKALRDYKKVQIQLESLETNVRDQCKKQFTDLMTEMNDVSSDLLGMGIPFRDYKLYTERIFFPGSSSPLSRSLDVSEARRQTVEQGLSQLSCLLNSKPFLTKFIHTLERQPTFSARDRGCVASLLTVALHGNLEYYTDILKTLLNDLMEQYVAKNPKLMLRRTETVVEKMLTNWMSICLYKFLKETAGESLFTLFKAIKHQVEKGPVDVVLGKAKYSLNDNRLLGEDVEYQQLMLNVTVQGSMEEQPTSVRLLDCDSIHQAKEKILEQVYKNLPFSQRPAICDVDLEWRNGYAGHLVLSDEDVTSVSHGRWKRVNTLQHYKVPDGATVALVQRFKSSHVQDQHRDHCVGERTPMLEDGDEGGFQRWHLVKSTDDVEVHRSKRSSMRDRDRTKVIPEIYLTRLLSMKGILQKFVDDFFRVVLSTSRPVPPAVKYFFDFLDEAAERHGIEDPETIHIWKTNSLPLRFWVNILKNPNFVFDVQVSDIVDASLSVIAQTFMDSCTTQEQKLGRDSPINKLLYAREISGYKKMVEKYYADIRQMVPVRDEDMRTELSEESRNNSNDLNSMVALHELYTYVNKYYDQVITALEDDPHTQKMQLAYRLQQVAAAVENKVTDL